MVIKAQSNCNPSVNINFAGLCAGKSELLIATPTNGGLSPFYTWKRNNVIIPIFGNKTTDAGLGTNSINEVVVVGNVIYAATTGGLSISTNSGSTFSNKTKSTNGLGNDAVNGLFINNTKIFAATSTGLSISEDNGNTFTNRTTANGLGSNIVNDVFVDATGEKVYAATNGGLSVSTNSGASFTNKSIGNVRGLFVDGNNVYAATNNGLEVSTDGGVNFDKKTTTNGLGNNIINDVFKVGNILFVATAGGLSISSDNGNTFSNKTTTSGLANNNVSSVYAIGSFIYASTNNGLSLSNDNGNSFFISETTADGLGTNTINGAFAVGNNIYAATTGGLAIATIDRIQVNNVIANDIYSVTMLPAIDVCPTPTPVSKTLPIYRLPIPRIITNSPVCTAMPLNLNATNEQVNTGNSYSWTGPNAYSSTNQNPNFPSATVTLSGTYSVTVTDLNGCTSTTSAPVTVNPLPIPNVNSNSPICTAFTLNLNATNTRNIVGNSYAWTGPNAYTSTNQNPSLPNATVALSGTYSVTITDINGCTATATTAAIVNPLPILSVANNSPICTAFTLNLTATNERNAVGNTYAWTGPNAYLSTNQNPSFSNATVSLSGIYSVTITDANACTATATTRVTVNPLPIPSVSNNSPICEAFTLNLSASNTRNTNGNSYAWTGPNAYLSSNQNPSFSNATVSLSGIYSVTITDANACTATATTSVTVNPLPIPSVSNNSPICEAFTLNLSASNTRNTNGNSYAWTGPNAYLSSNQNPSFSNATVGLSGIYSVTITDANGCTATATTSIIIKPKPSAPMISVPSQSVVCFPNTLTLIANGCSGTVTWSNNSTGSTITLSTIGIYSLAAKCTVDGCESEISSLITGLEIKVAPTAQASNNGPYIVGQTINLSASNGPNYTWTGPNNFTSLVSSPTISNATLQNNGIYSVTVSINGCTATATTNVIVNNFTPCSPQRIVDYNYVKAGNPHQSLFPISDGLVIEQIVEQTSIIVTPVCPTITIESIEMKVVGPELNFLTVQNVPLFALFSNEGLDVFGRNFTPGDYTLTVTGYSQDDRNGEIVYGPVHTNFKVVGTLGMISMPTLSSQSLCAGSSIDVSFTTSGNFVQVSQFQVQLSDANGSFQNPTTIGTSNTTGTVSCFIPANMAEGTNYLIRVATANQLAIGNPTMNFITVNPVNATISENISTGTVNSKATQTLTANNKIIAPAHVNYQAGKVISLNAGFEATSGSVFKAEIKGCN